MRASSLIDDFAFGYLREKRIVLGLKLQRQDIERDSLGDGMCLSPIFQREWKIGFGTVLKHGDIEIMGIVSMQKRTKDHDLPDFLLHLQTVH